MAPVVDTLRLTAEQALRLVEHREVSPDELHTAYLEAIGERDDENDVIVDVALFEDEESDVLDDDNRLRVRVDAEDLVEALTKIGVLYPTDDGALRLAMRKAPPKATTTTTTTKGKAKP